MKRWTDAGRRILGRGRNLGSSSGFTTYFDPRVYLLSVWVLSSLLTDGVTWNRDCEQSLKGLKRGLEENEYFSCIGYWDPHLDAPSSDLDWGVACPAQFHSILELVLLFLRWRQTCKFSSKPTWPSSRPVYSPLGLRLCQDSAQIPEPSDWGPWSGDEDKTLLKPLASHSSCLAGSSLHTWLAQIPRAGSGWPQARPWPSLI